MAIACGGGDATEPRVQNPDTPTIPPAATEPLISPTNISETSSTAIAPSPEQTPTQEVKQEVPCQILEQQFCNQYEVIEWKYQGNDYKIIAFSLPPGTPVYSPVKGQLLKGKYDEGDPFIGSLGAVVDPADGTRRLSFIGDLGFNNNLTEDTNAGDMIATIQDTGAKNFGEYNLIFMANRTNASGMPETDVELLDELFPNFSSRPSSQTIEQTTPVESSIGSPIYSDDPPY